MKWETEIKIEETTGKVIGYIVGIILLCFIIPIRFMMKILGYNIKYNYSWFKIEKNG